MKAIVSEMGATLSAALLGCSECSVTDMFNDIDHCDESNSLRDGREWTRTIDLTVWSRKVNSR